MLKTAAALVCAIAAALAAPAASAAPPAVLTFGRFGEVDVYRSEGTPARNVVLFLSGDGGWNLGVISMARRLTGKGAVVAGLDIRHYLAQLEKSTDKCVSPASELENLSRYLQSTLGLKDYLQPTLVGYSSGATLAYAALVQAPDGMFKGALSIGFCPDLDVKKPLCKGSGIESAPRRDARGVLKGVDFLPAKQLSGKWISLQGEIDQVCPAPATQAFIESVPGARIVMLPKVGHGYSVEKNWVPQYQAAYDEIAGTPAQAAPRDLPAPVADLPLTLVPAARGGSSPWFGIFLSGDGGWVGFDRGVSRELAKHHIPIVGWDSLKYFWLPRTPQGASEDLDRVVRHYSQEWDKTRVLLIGFSQGADTLPFMVNRLPPQTHGMVGLTALLGLSDNAVFEFHVANWVGSPSSGMATAPELRRWSGAPYLCLYGESDKDSACDELTGKEGIVVKMPGGHHFGGRYADIAAQILSRLSER